VPSAEAPKSRRGQSAAQPGDAEKARNCATAGHKSDSRPDPATVPKNFEQVVEGPLWDQRSPAQGVTAKGVDSSGSVIAAIGRNRRNLAADGGFGEGRLATHPGRSPWPPWTPCLGCFAAVHGTTMESSPPPAPSDRRPRRRRHGCPLPGPTDGRRGPYPPTLPRSHCTPLARSFGGGIGSDRGAGGSSFTRIALRRRTRGDNGKRSHTIVSRTHSSSASLTPGLSSASYSIVRTAANRAWMRCTKATASAARSSGVIAARR
jgi:hypothetical protein